MPEKIVKKKKENKRLTAKEVISSAKLEKKINKKFSMLYGRPSKPLRIGSLFSGIGGFEQALNLLKVKYQVQFACDSDKFVKQAYFANHGKKNLDEDWYDDVINFSVQNANKYKNKIDLLVGGPPCQSFSIIGKHGGLSDARGNLVSHFIKIIKKTNPKIFIFENVKGLLMIKNGIPWESVRKKFNNLGYKIHINILNSKNYGIPQNRERLFIIGFRNKKIDYAWPKPWPLEKMMSDFLETKTNKKYLLPKKGIDFVLRERNRKKRFTNVNALIQSTQKANQQFNWHGDFVSVDYKTYMDRYTLSDLVREFVMDDGSKSFKAKPQTDLDVARTILSTCHKMHRAGVDNYIKRSNGKDIRRLTPRECLNLMGWVDKKYNPIAFKTEYNGAQISDTQLYRQAGNSIVVWVAAQILSTLRFDKLGI